MSRINKNSDFWIGNLTGSSSDMWWRDEEVTKKKGKDLVALAGYRRAIANFVNIVTNKQDVPVRFVSSGDSYTDGKSVTLSSNINDKNFDPIVGLALHEGSHIVHSDFELLKDLRTHIETRYKINVTELDYEDRAKFNEMLGRIKSLLNYVEDRRIDYVTFRSAPGYKNYYHSMYDKYFNFKVINKALKSGEYRDASSWDSYEFRIINFTNPNTDLDALPGLREIYRVINLKNISRLKSTEDCLEIACQMYDIIKENLVELKTEGEEAEDQNFDSNLNDDESESSDKGSDSDSDEMSADKEGDEAGDGEGSEFPELSAREESQTSNAFSKQKQLIQGETPKSKLSKKDSGLIKAVEQSGAYSTEVGYGDFNRVNCIVVPRITEGMINTEGRWNSGAYDFIRRRSYHNYDEAIARGLQLGTILGKKLQIRNEEKTLKWTRQDSGKMDRRLISELGFGNSRIFQSTFTEKYNDAFLHLSIDASGSMSGDKFANSLKCAAAICKASSMVGNIHVQVSIRTTNSTGGHNDHKPLIAIIYDSKVNKVAHIKKYWKYVDANGVTPEGLCFEAISKEIINDANGRDAYFLNLSDGMPWYSDKDMYYGGDSAFKHTAKEVNKFKNVGISVLSFFVTEGYGREDNLRDFKKMYGDDAVTIDPTNVVSLAKVLNAKFLEA